MRLLEVIKGIISFVPGIYPLFAKRTTGGTDSAKYCYDVWLKHLTLLWEYGMHEIPDTIAELGPGDSIGVGLAALLSGVRRYYALDVVEYADTERNLLIFNELINLFKNRAGRPTKGWPDYDRYLDSNLFPSHILTEKVLSNALTQERIDLIKNTILDRSSGDKLVIKYIVPWNDRRIIDKETIDVIFSHSVLEHVSDLDGTYEAFSQWLKPNGRMSHQIDLSSHGLAQKWNGHWAYSELLWKITVGKRRCKINRQPCSKHIALLERNGFEIICLLKNSKPDGIVRSELSPYWRSMTEEDLRCSGLFIQARKA